jgi:hypothetical protein
VSEDPKPDDGAGATFARMRTVTQSSLPAHLRHFLLTLAFLADNATGKGWHSQQTIGKAMGVSERMVRKYLDELDHRDDAPLRIQRRRRGTADGKGRSSDEWQLVLELEALNRNSTSGSDPRSTGTQVPLEAVSTGTQVPLQPALPGVLGGAQPELCDSSTGTLRQLNRNPGSDNPPLIPFLDPPTSSAPHSRKRRGKKPSKKSKARAPLHPRTDEMKKHYISRYEHRKGEPPDFGKNWPRAMLAFSALCGVRDGFDAGAQAVTNALANEFNHRLLPWEIANELPKHQGRQSRTGRRIEVQRGGLNPDLLEAARARGEALAAGE